MIAAQNVITTETMAHIVAIGVGGLMPPPIATCVTAVTTAPTASVTAVSASPLFGCGCCATHGGLLPQVTAATICMGMMQRRKYATQPAKSGNGNTEMKASAMTIT